MRHLGIDLDGGFAEYAVVPESNVFPLSAETPLDEAVMLSSALPAAVLMGIVNGSATLHFEDFLFDCIKRELTIIATFGFTRADFLLGNALYESGALDLRPLIGPTVALEGVPEALAAIAAAGTGGKRQVVDIAMR